MSQHGPSAPTPEKLREQARRARAHARHLVGDPGADRLLDLASELEAQANAMEEPTVRLARDDGSTDSDPKPSADLHRG